LLVAGFTTGMWKKPRVIRRVGILTTKTLVEGRVITVLKLSSALWARN